MANKDKKQEQPAARSRDGELGDSVLDAVSGGQGPKDVQKMEPIVVTAKRLVATAPPVQHMEPIVVVAKKPTPGLEGEKFASAGALDTKKP
jgi:hypothetical protein